MGCPSPGVAWAGAAVSLRASSEETVEDAVAAAAVVALAGVAMGYAVLLVRLCTCEERLWPSTEFTLTRYGVEHNRQLTVIEPCAPAVGAHVDGNTGCIPIRGLLHGDVAARAIDDRIKAVAHLAH